MSPDSAFKQTTQQAPLLLRPPCDFARGELAFAMLAFAMLAFAILVFAIL